MMRRVHCLLLLSPFVFSLFLYLFFFSSFPWRSSSPSTTSSFSSDPNTAPPDTPPPRFQHTFKLKHIFHRPLTSSTASSSSTRRKPSSSSSSSSNVFFLSPPHLSLVQWIPPAAMDALSANNAYPFPHRFHPTPDFTVHSHATDVPTSFAVSAATPVQSMVYLAPDISDQSTVLSLAHMAASTYLLPNNPDWVPIDGYKTNVSFGWNNDGLRGYVYTTDREDLVIVAIKGTTASFLGIGGDTAPNDKTNDNHMFSCCCAHVDFTWKPICDCYSSGRHCNKTCLRENSRFNSSYYQASLDLYHAIWQAYPTAMLWFTGHSLGGALAGLLALTYVRPAVTFEAPGERQFAQLVGLPTTSAVLPFPLYHVGVDVDPIFLGHCQGVASPCYHAGYAIETRCHAGYTCMYKATDVGWREELRHHRIAEVIQVVQALKAPPKCYLDTACVDCGQWHFY